MREFAWLDASVCVDGRWVGQRGAARHVQAPAPLIALGAITVGWAYSPFFLDFMADIFALTQEALAGMDVELVDVERAPLGLLRVTIDRPDGVRIEDCEQVSKQLSRVFEV